MSLRKSRLLFHLQVGKTKHPIKSLLSSILTIEDNIVQYFSLQPKIFLFEMSTVIGTMTEQLTNQKVTLYQEHKIVSIVIHSLLLLPCVRIKLE